MFDDAWKNWLAGILVAIVVIAGGIGLAYLVIEEEKAWQIYKVKAHCQQIDYIPGYNQLDYIDKKGNPHYRWISARTIYKCDNEEIVER